MKYLKNKLNNHGSIAIFIFLIFVVIAIISFISFGAEWNILLNSLKNALDGSLNTLNTFFNEMKDTYF